MPWRSSTVTLTTSKLPKSTSFAFLRSGGVPDVIYPTFHLVCLLREYSLRSLIPFPSYFIFFICTGEKERGGVRR